ncbi:MAG: hypothetical protein ACXW1B_01940 [Nitrososphaeraceae archaeon]
MSNLKIELKERFIKGAHSLVLGSIPDNSLAVGNPAKVIKQIQV